MMKRLCVRVCACVFVKIKGVVSRPFRLLRPRFVRLVQYDNSTVVVTFQPGLRTINMSPLGLRFKPRSSDKLLPRLVDPLLRYLQEASRSHRV